MYVHKLMDIQNFVAIATCVQYSDCYIQGPSLSTSCTGNVILALGRDGLDTPVTI